MAEGETPTAAAADAVESTPPVEPTHVDAEAGDLPIEPSLGSIDFSSDLGAMSASPVALPELGGHAPTSAGRHFGLLLDVGVEVAAVVGTRELRLEQVLAIQPGEIIDLDRHAGEPIELYVNGKPIALAEIVVVDGRLGARVVETLKAAAAHPDD